MALTTKEIKLSPAGAAGSATAQAVVGVPPCTLVGVRFDYTSMPATTDVTITNMGRAVATRSNSGTDAFVQPRENVVDTAGTAAPAGDNRWDPPVLHGVVTIDVAQADAGTDGVIVTLFIDQS